MQEQGVAHGGKQSLPLTYTETIECSTNMVSHLDTLYYLALL